MKTHMSHLRPWALALTVMVGIPLSLPAPAADLLKDPSSLDSAEKWRSQFGVATPGGQGPRGKTRSVVLETAPDKSKAAATVQATGVETDATPRRVDVQINFKLNSAAIASEWESPLNGLATLLRQDPALALEIEGHTDARGSAQYNKVLSKKRAAAVRDYLVRLTPAAKERLTAIGRGSQVLFNKDDAYDSANRRVSFSVTAK